MTTNNPTATAQSANVPQLTESDVIRPNKRLNLLKIAIDSSSELLNVN
jgi:hypothetical protein